MLYNELEAWVKKETQRAKVEPSLDAHDRQLIYNQILDKVSQDRIGAMWGEGIWDPSNGRKGRC